MKQLNLKLIHSDNKKIFEVDYLFVLENIHNHIYANDGLSSNESLDVVINILFIKFYDELNNLGHFYISSEEQIELLNGRNNNKFISRFENLRIQTFKHFEDIFKDNKKFNIKSSTLAYIIKKLEKFEILKTNDLFGKAFLKFLSSAQRNSRGQFFTPDEVINFCVNFLKPTTNQKILDPACGSGSFLISVKNYFVNNKLKSNNNIFGIEINSSAAKIAKLNMILSGINHKNIINADSLKNLGLLEKNIDQNSIKLKNYFDLIITNPPFGTTGKISDKSILKNFKLACKWNKYNNSYLNSEKLLPHQVPEILFIERCIELLKPSGKMAIILPNGNLENPTLKYLRHFISYTCDVLSVIKLPQDTFVHSGTGVKTSVLFLKKKDFNNQSLQNSNDIFFSEIKKIGLTANKSGKKLYKKDSLGNTLKDNNGNLVIDEDCSEVLFHYNKYLKNRKIKNTNNSFIINKRIFSYSRFNYEFYDPKYKKIYLNFNEKNSFSLKDLVNIVKDKSDRLITSNLSVSYIELSDVISDYSEIQKSEILKVHQLPSRATYEINTGDLITSVSGNAIGTKKHASAIVTEKFSGSICSNGFRVFNKFSEKIDKYYLLYYFKTNLFLDQIFRLRTGSAIPTIQDEDLLNILIKIPSEKKMKKISSLIKQGFRERESFKQNIQKINL